MGVCVVIMMAFSVLHINNVNIDSFWYALLRSIHPVNEIAQCFLWCDLPRSDFSSIFICVSSRWRNGNFTVRWARRRIDRRKEGMRKEGNESAIDVDDSRDTTSWKRKGTNKLWMTLNFPSFLIGRCHMELIADCRAYPSVRFKILNLVLIIC